MTCGRTVTVDAARVLIVMLLAPMDVSAQQRPAIPERACTRVDLVASVGPGRQVGLRIVNGDPGSFTARLRSELRVEQLVAGSWQPVSTAGLELRASCSLRANPCVEIPAGASLNVSPWLGTSGDAQCVCTRCVPAPTGTYRFAVTTCQECLTPRVQYSAPFSLP